MPFNRFRTVDGRNVDTLLGPEMRSTGEVMGFDATFGTAFAKAQIGGLRRASDVRAGVRVGRQPRQAAHDLPDQAARRPRLRDPRDRGHGAGAAPQRRLGDRRAQALRRAGPGRRADDRRPDPGRRRRPGGQHAARHDVRRLAAGRRLRDPDGVGRRATSPASPRCRDSAPRCRRSRRCARATSTCGRCRAGAEPTSTRKERSDPDRRVHRPPERRARTVQVRGEVFSLKRVGDYHHLTIVADGIAERTRPGNFVALAVGGETSGALLRRAFSIYRVRPAGSTAAPSRSCSPRTAPGTRVAGSAASRTTDRRRRPARSAVRAAQGAGGVRPGRRRLRVGADVRPGGAAARARLRGPHGARRRDRGAAVRGARGEAVAPSRSR